MAVWGLSPLLLPSPCLPVDHLGRRPGCQTAVTPSVGARRGEQIYRKAFIWEDIQRYLGSGLLVCGADGEEESWLSG